jgi:CheY-like chemotaxis protein
VVAYTVPRLYGVSFADNRLPLAMLKGSVDMSVEPNLQAENAAIPLQGVRLLIVDDNIDTRTLFAFILEDKGAQVLLAKSIEEALDAIEKAKPHLLISDINLSGEDGYSLIRKVRGLNPEQGGQIPAIAVTGALPEEGFEPSSSEFQMHLTKPVDPDDLVNAATALTRDLTLS